MKPREEDVPMSDIESDPVAVEWEEKRQGWQRAIQFHLREQRRAEHALLIQRQLRVPPITHDAPA